MRRMTSVHLKVALNDGFLIYLSALRVGTESVMAAYGYSRHRPGVSSGRLTAEQCLEKHLSRPGGKSILGRPGDRLESFLYVSHRTDGCCTFRRN